MATVPWKRVLETLYTRGASDVLLVPGSPPAIRCRGEGWRMLDLGALDEGDVRAMAEELLSGGELVAGDGWTRAEVWHEDVHLTAMGLGYPQTRVLLVARTSPPAPEGVVTGLECEVCGVAATVHATEVREGTLVEVHLCAEHAGRVKPEGFS